jgi:hypothetical protein
MVSDKQRRSIVNNAQWLLDHKQHINYAEARPIPYLLGGMRGRNACQAAFGRNESLDTDCSGSVTIIFNWSGLPDPNGQNYDGQGYTGDLYDHLINHYTNVLDAEPGALIIFGVDPTVHVAMLMEKDGEDPWLFSHGQQGGPYYIRLSDERQNHVGQAETWLSINQL